MAGNKRTLLQWLRALDHCGVMRVDFGCDRLVAAWELGLVDYSPVSGSEDKLDFQLTEHGKRTISLCRLAA